MRRPGLTHIDKRHRFGRRLLALATVLAVATAALAVGSLTASSPKHSRQEVARHILHTKAGSLMTASGRVAVDRAAGLERPQRPSDADGGPDFGKVSLAKGGAGADSPAFTNVRVNNPAADTLLDQTTQSETTVAVSGSNVVVGYNDSQHSLPFFTAALNLTGYAYSSNGGATWTDAGVLPNAPGAENVGDPWLATDRAGKFYYATLIVAADTLNGNIGVARSTNGGKTFSPPVNVSPPDEFFGDKEAMTTGPDPVTKSRDNLYVTWDNFGCDDTGCFEGLVLARSIDSGATWTTSYLDKHYDVFDENNPDCSFQQYIGAQPLVDPKDGTLYIAAERFSVVDVGCLGGTFTQEQSLFVSTNGGATFGPRIKIADVTSATPFGAVNLGPGQFMRTIEFPVMAIFKNALYVAWNNGSNASSDHSHIRLAKSTNRGSSWSLSWVTSGSNDEYQPALSADAGALHLLYYQRNANNTLDVRLGNSTSGSSFNSKRVTTTSFPGVLTVPQFDPIIAWGYMGDYIANASDGSHVYLAWGDNRDKVVNQLWTDGRNDPNVYFAKQ